MKLLEILREEWRDLFRGRWPLAALIFGVPLAFALLFGAIYGENTVKHIPLVVYDQDQSSLSRTLVTMYGNSERYEVAYQVTSQQEMEDLVAADDAMAALQIPRDFSKNVKKGNGATLMFLVNSTNNMFGNAALSSAQEINRSFSVAVGQKLTESLGVLPSAAMDMAYPVHFGIRILNNPTNGYTPFMLAGLMLNGLQISIMLIVPPLLIRELNRRRYGPEVSSLVFMAGKAIPAWCLGMLSFPLSLLVVVYGFDVPMRGSWLEAWVLIGGFLFMVVCAMLLFSACSPTEVMSLQMPMLYIMPGLLYSGLSWPVFSMNEVAWWLSRLLPMTYTGDNLRDIMLAGTAPTLWTDLGQMLGVGLILVFLAAGIFSFRRRRNFKKGGAADGTVEDH